MQTPGDFSKASPREIQILELLCEGCENAEIVLKLKEAGIPIAHRTVKAHFNRMYMKHQITCGYKRVKLAVLYYRWQCAQTFAARNQKR